MSKPKIQSLEINLSLCQNKQSLESPQSQYKRNTHSIFPQLFLSFQKINILLQMCHIYEDR